jgi:hypothetical protein
VIGAGLMVLLGCVRNEVDHAGAVALAPTHRLVASNGEPSRDGGAPREAEAAVAADGRASGGGAATAMGVVEPEAAVEAAVIEEQPEFRRAIEVGETEAQRVSKRIANASPGQCREEVRRRKLAVTLLGGGVAGVAAAVRLSGELSGVRFVGPGRKSVYGILDCRLAVVLDELAKLLAPRGVVAVHVDNFYRPRSRLPGRRKKSQHAYGLAIDIYGFTLADGTTLVVERDFHGTIGSTPCGPDADRGPHGKPQAVTLRNLTCAIAQSRLFNHLLTPGYDRAHSNHLHADIQRGAKEYGLR